MNQPPTFDVAVVGRGMFGSAAARHLAEAGSSVVAIGPTTPPTGPSRVYASHDDEARLTTPIAADGNWAHRNRHAIDAYADIEQRSGIEFHRPVGLLHSARPGGDGRNGDPIPTLRRHATSVEIWEAGDRGWKERWPRLEFPETHTVAYEAAPAGYIRPKRLIGAQETLTVRSGGLLVDDIVVGLDGQPGDQHRLTTAAGARFDARRVVLTGGAFTTMLGIVPDVIDITTKTEITVLGEVTESDAAALADYPAVLHQIDPDQIDDIYLTPPLRYPDGRCYIKLGANTTLDTWPTQLADVHTWFESDHDAGFLPLLAPALRALWPDVRWRSMRTKPCIVTYTPDGAPLIAEVANGLVIATAGNGAGAMGSDAWGAAAADLVLDR